MYQNLLLAALLTGAAIGQEDVGLERHLRGVLGVSTSEDHNGFSTSKRTTNRNLWEGDEDLGILEGQSRDRSRTSSKEISEIPSTPSSQLLTLDIDNRVVPVDYFAAAEGIMPRIVGGTDSELESFAIHLKWDDLEQNWTFAGCGGTLISNCHVLTAAHCVTFPRRDVTEAVYINAWRPFRNNSDGTQSKPYHVSRILPDKTVVHEGFQSQDNFNDIAILTLETCTDGFELMPLATPDFERTLLMQNNFSTRVAGFLDVYLPKMPQRQKCCSP